MINVITVDIAASGNLELSVMEDLAFEMAGTVEEVLVATGAANNPEYIIPVA